MKLSARLQEYRRQQGRGWDALEENLGVPTRSFYRYAKGEARLYPTPEYIEIMARALGVSKVEVILGYAEDIGFYDPARDGALVSAEAVEAVEGLRLAAVRFVEAVG